MGPGEKLDEKYGTLGLVHVHPQAIPLIVVVIYSVRLQRRAIATQERLALEHHEEKQKRDRFYASSVPDNAMGQRGRGLVTTLDQAACVLASGKTVVRHGATSL